VSARQREVAKTSRWTRFAGGHSVEAGPESLPDDPGRLRRVVWIDAGDVTRRARSILVPASVELAAVNARPRDAVDVQVDGDDER